jgi:predicted  nucleic acid-binding Zn-ribbon protein
MIELLMFGAGAACGAVALMLPYNRVQNERDLLEVTKNSLALDVEQLKARANTLRGDNLALQKEVANLTNTNVELQREVGRNIAERRAAMMAAPAEREKGAIAFTPKRDANGRFAAKPKA